ncbi:MAG: ABC transporter permease [Butyrivibrio sp.]|nr:ABC transporter permease [Butyrivibrio sp.]
MIHKLLKRIAGLVLILVILSFFVFALLYIAPGDPAEKRLTSQGVAVTKQVLDAERARLGLFRPFLVRYGEWLFGVVRGDFGVSFKDDLPVAPKLFQGLQNTCLLAVSSLLMALLLSFGLSIASVLNKDGPADHLVRICAFVSNSLPNFLISVMLMYLLCIRLDLFPVIAAKGDLRGLVMPVLSLTIPMCGRFTRQMRAEFLDQMRSDYVTGMRGRGVRTRYILLNVVRNALGHIFTIVALQIGTLMGGSVVIETIFRWPGIGKLVMDAITARDYPVIMGFVVIMGTIYVVINQLSDIINHILDPRTAL